MYRMMPKRHLLYDTEAVPEGPLPGRELRFFCYAMGMHDQGSYFAGKTQAETNLTMCGQLPMPYAFDLTHLRLAMPLTTPYVDRVRVYCHGLLRISFGVREVWAGPLQAIPCGTLLEFPDVPDAEAFFRKQTEEGELNALEVGKSRLSAATLFQAKVTWPSYYLHDSENGPEACRRLGNVLEGCVPLTLYLGGRIWNPEFGDLSRLESMESPDDDDVDLELNLEEEA